MGLGGFPARFGPDFGLGHRTKVGIFRGFLILTPAKLPASQLSFRLARGRSGKLPLRSSGLPLNRPIRDPLVGGVADRPNPDSGVLNCPKT